MTATLDGKACLTLPQAAAELSTTELRILMLVKQKVLEGAPTDEGWVVTRESVLRFDPADQETMAELQCRSTCTASRCGCH